MDFSLKTISKSREIYKNGSLAENEDIRARAEHLAGLKAQLKIPSGTPSTGGNVGQLFDDGGRLQRLTENISKAADELILELQNLQLHHGKGRKRQAFLQSIKSRMKKSSIDAIQKSLEHYQQILETQTLVDLRFVLTALRTYWSNNSIGLTNTLGRN